MTWICTYCHASSFIETKDRAENAEAELAKLKSKEVVSMSEYQIRADAHLKAEAELAVAVAEVMEKSKRIEFLLAQVNDLNAYCQEKKREVKRLKGEVT